VVKVVWQRPHRRCRRTVQ